MVYDVGICNHITSEKSKECQLLNTDNPNANIINSNKWKHFGWDGTLISHCLVSVLQAMERQMGQVAADACLTEMSSNHSS